VSTNVGARVGAVRANGSAADVWCAWVSDHAAMVDALSSTLLSDAERLKMSRYGNLDAAARYVITRSLVRAVLGEVLRISPRDVEVRVTDLGKPVVSEDLHFNVSHSGDLITLAVSHDRAVGIDVERRREVQRVNALIARWLTPAERDEVALLARNGLDDSNAFLRVWSVKEAKLKALGVGISGATSADVSNVVAAPLDDILSHRADGSGYVGAVAFA
jgi:4'-phosphopantetheinyl transferase